MEKETNEILEIVIFLKDQMATKDDIARLDTKIDMFRNEIRAEMHEGFAAQHVENRELRREVIDLHKRLDELKEMARSNAGMTKEIDHALGRIRAIETHLGVQPQMAV